MKSIIDREKYNAYQRAWKLKNPDKVKGYERSYYARNREKLIDKMRQWRIRFPRKARAQWVGRREMNPMAWKGYRLKFEYGLSLDQWNQMFKDQNGCCAVCGKHSTVLKKGLHVDHDHKTGKVRGLVCGRCNIAIGYLEDKEICLKVTLFLQRFE